MSGSSPHSGTIEEAVESLRGGGVCVIPTETVYGLVGLTRQPVAIERLLAIKGDRQQKPFGVLVSSSEMAQELSGEWPREASALARALWPGPLTMIVSASANVPPNLNAGGTTVGVRMPDHPLALEIIDRLGEGLASTSANRSHQPAPTSAAEAERGLEGEDLIVVDGGACREGVASSVISLVDPSSPIVLREGGVSRERFEAILGVSVRGPGGG